MANAQEKSGKGPLVWIAGLIAAIAIVFALRAFTRDTVTVRVAPVTYQNLLSTVSTNGKVEPIEVFQAHSPAPAIVQKIFVEVNQHVERGTPLLNLSDADARARLASAQSQVASAQLSRTELSQGGTPEEKLRFSQDINAAQAEQRNARNDLASVTALEAKGAAAHGEVLRAQQRLQTADQSVRNAQSRTTGRYSGGDTHAADARIADARAAVVAAQSALSALDIRSPIAGTVYAIPVSTYDSVPAGDDLMDIADLNRIQVRAYFDEPEIGKLARGQAVKIVWDARPDRAWHGHLERAPTTVITYGTRNVGEAVITVDDARGDLLPNTNVTVTVTASQRFNALSIPREALHTDGAINFVYRLVNGKLLRTQVQTGVVNLTSVEILSGVKPEDVIVLGPTTTGRDLADGMSVKRSQ